MTHPLSLARRNSEEEWLGPDVRESLFSSYNVLIVIVIGLAGAWILVGSAFEQPFGFFFYTIVIILSLSSCLFLYKAFVLDFRR